MATPRPVTKVEDYRVVLQLPHQDHLIIVGGQAVSIWADRYLQAEPELQQYLPFTSKDLDLLGDAVDLHQLSKATGFKRVMAPQKVLIPSAGFIEMPRQNAVTVKIEILKRIYGVTTQEAKATALVVERDGVQYRVLHPLMLLKAKAEASVYLPQDNSGQERQDVRHLKMVILCVRGFLRELIAQVENNKLSARDCINLLEETLTIATSRAAADTKKKFGVVWDMVLPLESLESASNPKLKNFFGKRLPRLLDQLKG